MKYRILYFQHTSIIGGASWSLLQIVSALDRNKYDPFVVLPGEGPLTIALKKKKINFLIDPRIRPFLKITSKIFRSYDWANLSGLIHYHCAVKAAHEHVQCIAPDIVHINTSVLLHLAIGVRKSGAIPTIIHLRENWELHPSDFRARLKDKILEKRVDEVVSISKVAAERFAPGRRYSYVPNWVDFTDRGGDINLREFCKISSDVPIILAPSSRSWIKGAHVAIDAIRQLDLPYAVLVILGARGQMNRVKKYSKKILKLIKHETYGMRLDRMVAESSSRAVLAPYILEVRSAIEQSKIVVSPFVFPHFSKAIIEAGACERPVIASDNPYNREVVIDGLTGYLVPPGDPGSLASAMSRLLKDPDLCHRMGVAGRKFIEERFSRDRSLKKLFDLYDKMSSMRKRFNTK